MKSNKYYDLAEQFSQLWCQTHRIKIRKDRESNREMFPKIFIFKKCPPLIAQEFMNSPSSNFSDILNINVPKMSTEQTIQQIVDYQLPLKV